MIVYGQILCICLHANEILCIIRTSIFGPFSAGKKCVLYTGKYGNKDTLVSAIGDSFS